MSFRFLFLRRAAVLGSLALACAHATAQERGFNPKISLILQGSYANDSSDAEAEMPGILLGPETEPRPEGFSLAESELVLEANVDDRFRGWATVALEQEDGETVVALEEAYVQTLTLPAGLGLKFGRFLSGLGYQNQLHSHAWDFADLPLAYRALLAGQLRDDGLQLRWVAPTDLFLELGAEALQGRGFPAASADGEGLGAWAGFLRLGGDVGSGGAWRLGLAHHAGDATDRSGEENGASFTGSTRTQAIDFVYKWAPQGNWRERNLTVATEYLRREERGDVATEESGVPESSSYAGTQSGFYVQAAYQFIPRWRFGLRYDEVRTDNSVGNPVPDTSLENLAADAPARRYTAMLDFSNSEFSRLRLQLAQDRSRPDRERDDQVILQYVMSLGAHPAHQF